MGITYTDEKKFTKERTQQLFRSVGWVSGKYPERLYKALMGSSTVFSAWDGDRLVGLVRVLDDTEMVAYMHYVLVDPEYQGHGIAGHLVGMVKESFCVFFLRTNVGLVYFLCYGILSCNTRKQRVCDRSAAVP